MSGQNFNKNSTAKARVILHKKRGSYLFRLTYFNGKYNVIAYNVLPQVLARSFTSFSQAVCFYRLVQLPNNIKKVSLWSIHYN